MCRPDVVSWVDGSSEGYHVYGVREAADANAWSFDLDQVESIIGRTRPIIAGMDERTGLSIEGGSGLDEQTLRSAVPQEVAVVGG